MLRLIWPALVRAAGVRPGAQPVAVVVLPAALARRLDHCPARPAYRGRVVVPVLGKVTVAGCTDRVAVRLVSGQSPADFAARAEGIAHGFRAYLCRVRSSAPGAVVLELVRRDALADPMPALPIPDMTDLRALPVGRREDGTAVRDPAPGNAPAHRGRDRSGERLLPVGPGPGHAARDGGRSRPGVGV